MNSDQPGRVPINGPLLDVQAVADLLCVPASTVYAWVRQGRLPVLRIGPRALRWTPEMIEEWVATTLDERKPWR